MMKALRQHALYLAWLIACLALVASLVSSELAQIPVCKLCWFQRIALYPLALILGIAAYHEDRLVYRYVVPLAATDVVIAAYQYLLQLKPEWFPIHLCDMGPSCYTSHFQWLGFITYPLLSLLAGAAIGVLSWLARTPLSR